MTKLETKILQLNLGIHIMRDTTLTLELEIQELLQITSQQWSGILQTVNLPSQEETTG
jgi:hypothetical protein